MRKFLLILAVGILAFSLAGCEVVSTGAATVDGVTISQHRLDATIAAIAGNPGYRCVLEKEAGLSIDGAGQGTYSSPFVGDVLASLVVSQLLNQAAHKEGIEVTSAELPLASPEVAASLSPSLPAGQTPPCTESGQAMLAAFPASYRDLLLRQQSDVDALLAHSAHIDVSMPALRSYYAAHRAGFATTCLSVIVVSSKAQALSLASQIAAGASFASLANADSLEAHATNPGGSVGCFPVDSSLPSELASVVDGVRSGQVSSPVSYQGDWLLFKVDSRTSPSFDQAVASEVRSQLLSGLSGSIQTMERRLIDHASVTVDSRYGRWRGAAGLAAHSNILVPPTGPPARFVPNAAANRAPVGSSS